MLISVIIPCYNSEAFIQRAINSVLAQIHPHVEIILVDNNSTDTTFSILKENEKQHPEKVKVLREVKPGAPAARNLGLKESKGSWIQFLDADDIIYPDKFEKEIDFIKHKQPDVIINDYNKTAINGAVTTIIAEDNVWKGLIISKLGLTSCALWKRDALLDVNGWAESLTSSQEYDLLFRLLKRNHTVLITHYIAAQTFLQSESVSQTVNNIRLREVIENRINLRYRINDFLKESNLLTKELSIELKHFFIKQFLIFRDDRYFIDEQFDRFFSSMSFPIRLSGYFTYIQILIQRKFPKASRSLRYFLALWYVLSRIGKII
jgi:glycosyltransferase involved in cell wall biosynthesis